jgi:hypothetical protein
MKHCNVKDITSQNALTFSSDYDSAYSTFKVKGKTMTNYGIDKA